MREQIIWVTLNNNRRHVSVWLSRKFQCECVIILCKVFQCCFRGISEWLDFYVSYSHSESYNIYYGVQIIKTRWLTISKTVEKKNWKSTITTVDEFLTGLTYLLYVIIKSSTSLTWSWLSASPVYRKDIIGKYIHHQWINSSMIKRWQNGHRDYYIEIDMTNI